MQPDPCASAWTPRADRLLAALMLMCIMFAAGALGAAAPEAVYSFTPTSSGPTVIAVDCARRAEQPVNRLLYGKFAEHLGRNIYHGMWAQLVHNPGFATADMWGSNRARMAATQADAGLPPRWAVLGNAQGNVIQFSADHKALPERPCLRIDYRGHDDALSGIQQVLDLPIARQRVYQCSFHIRVSRDTSLTVRLINQEKAQVLAEQTVPVHGRAWQVTRCELHLPPGAEAIGSAFRFEVGIRSPATVWLDQCLLFPADQMAGWDPEVVRLTKESQLPILRWPGGNFVSGYHWKDGIGPAEKRPMRLNRPWNMPEPNYVGTDEFMRFCELAGCEPMICVNAGDGTAEEAADWVEYCNGSINTPMGRQRAANGHPKPYGVRYWEIGNELYGGWQIGHCTADEYAPRYREFVKAMQKRDPSVRFIANGNRLDWNRVLVDQCADILRAVSLHILIGGGMPPNTSAEKVWWSIAGYPWEFRHDLQKLSRQIRAKVPDGRLAITELQIFTNRPNLPNNGGLAEAMFWAGIVNTAIRAGDCVELITHSALLNHGGGLRKQREIVYANPVYLARRLYSTQPGRWPVAVSVRGPAFSAPRLHNLPAVTQAALVDVLALTTNTNDKLVLLVINHDPSEAADVDVTLASFQPQASATMQWISGDSIMARNSQASPHAVSVQQKTVEVSGTRFPLRLPARSLTAITLQRRSQTGTATK